MKTLKKVGIAMLTLGGVAIVSAYILIGVSSYIGFNETGNKLMSLAELLTFAIFMPFALIGVICLSISE